MKTTVIYHSADFDGLFCREIARKFLPQAELVGWDFADQPLPLPSGAVYVLDLPVDRVFGFDYRLSPEQPFVNKSAIVWIDHHKSSIETHPQDIPGYRIDGVAACRLAWQWFDDKMSCQDMAMLPSKQEFIDRAVTEPMAVRLAGEYDIWDKRDPNAELFQHGLRSLELTESVWSSLLASDNPYSSQAVEKLLENGKGIQYARTQENESVIKANGFTIEWEGLKFLACNHARFNSHLFTAGLKPEHDACFGFRWTGKDWSVSLYHAPGKEHHDLSQIAVKHGGGGHRGVCGFRVEKLSFLT